MAFDRPKSGAGATIAFATTTGLNAIQITNISFDGVSVTAMDLTHLGSTFFREKGPTELRDSGTITVGFLCDNDNLPLPGQTAANAAPIRETSITITVPITDGTNSTNGTIAIANAFISDSSWSYPNDDVAAGEYVIQGGALTFTDSAV